MAGLYDILYGSADAARAESAAREAALSGDASRARLATLLWGKPEQLGSHLAQMAQHDEGELGDALRARGSIGAEGLYSKLLLGSQKADAAAQLAAAREQERTIRAQLLQELKNSGALNVAKLRGEDAKAVAGIRADAQPNRVVVTPGGSVIEYDRRAPGHTTEVNEVPPKPSGSGNGSKPSKTFTPAEVQSLGAAKTELGSIDTLIGGFKPEYAGMGPLGNVFTAVEKGLGSSAPQASQARANFWADYKKLLEIPERHKFFGSALTPGEAKSWEQAKKLSPASDPQVVLSALRQMQTSRNRVLTDWAKGRAVEGYNPEAIKMYSGVDVAPPAAADSDVEDLLKKYGGK